MRLRRLWSTDPISALLFLVLFVTIVGYSLWFYALAEASVAAVAPIQFLQPVIGIVIAVSFLGEALSLNIRISGVLIIFGVWLTLRA